MLPLFVLTLCASGALHAGAIAAVQGDASREAQREPAQDGAEGSRFRDPEDGWLDVSRFLEHPAGFLPLVVPITEPALGYGAVGALVFLDPRAEAGGEGWARPNITAVGGLATEDGSDGLFAGNSTLWGDGSLQTLVGAGSLNLDLSLYGIGSDPALDDRSLDYAFDVDGVVAEVRKRLGHTDLWCGLRGVYGKGTVDFDDPPGGVGGVSPEDDDVTLAGPAVTLRYDTLDNMFTPTRGTLSDTSISFFGEAFGGSQDFQLLQQILIHHWPLAPDWFLGARGQFNTSFGDTPFYLRPYVHLRGVPALRYQGEQAFSTELELRWQFHRRISAVAFGGYGLAWNEGADLADEQDALSGGLGGRYLVSRKFGLHVGLDVAHGPEDGAIYVQVGNAWLRP